MAFLTYAAATCEAFHSFDFAPAIRAKRVLTRAATALRAGGNSADRFFDLHVPVSSLEPDA